MTVPDRTLLGPSFNRLWFGQTASLMGTQVSRLALPLVAIETLRAGPLAVSAVNALTTLPFPVFGLAVGAWVDRWSRRRVLVASDAGRALALLSVPLVLVLDSRGGLLWLCVVAVVVGTLTVFFDVAHGAYLPALVEREHLERANGRLAMSDTLARLTGPGLGGGLVQLVGAPLAVLADGLSYVLSALALVTMPSVESPSARTRARLRDQLRDGLRHVLGAPVLRALLATGVVLNLFDAGVSALLLLFLTRTVGMSPVVVGLAFAVGAVGGLVAATHVAHLRQRLGPRRAMVVALMCIAVARLMQAALPHGVLLPAFLLLLVSQVMTGYGAVTFNVVQVSLRQRLTPDPMLGRMTATMRAATWGVLPVGAALGGALGQWWGVRPGVLATACGTALAPVLLALLLRDPDLPAGQPAAGRGP